MCVPNVPYCILKEDSSQAVTMNFDSLTLFFLNTEDNIISVPRTITKKHVRKEVMQKSGSNKILKGQK